MLHIDPREHPTREVHGYLLGGVGPRPIALVSTLSPDGHRNLSPFSFFNAFGANPPTIAFSPARRVRDNTTKHTYENLIETRECVVQSVTYDMVQQISLASTEYEENVDEFAKSGLTPIESDVVKPFRVKESPFQMECKLSQMVELGGEAGSGNLAICEVVRFHIAEDIFEDGVIHPNKIDLVARMSANFYSRASGDSVFVVKKPLTTRGIGYDQLPDFIRESDILTANNLGQLGNTEQVPDEREVQAFVDVLEEAEADLGAYYRAERLGDYNLMLRTALALHKANESGCDRLCVRAAKRALDFDDTDFAWKTLLHSRTLK